MKKIIIRSSFLILFFTVNSFAQSNISSKDAARLCKDVNKIKEFPRDWGQRGVDTTYDSIIDGGEAVVPCLIDNITNTKVMRDPRCPTISTATTIGDVSYYVPVDMLKLSFTEFLPEDIEKTTKHTERMHITHILTVVAQERNSSLNCAIGTPNTKEN